MKNEWNIEDYQLISDKDKFNWINIAVLFLAILGVFIVLCTFEFQIYEKQTLIKNNNEFLLMIESKKISELESKFSLYINQKEYRYDIQEISQDYTNIDNVIYQTIHINPYNYKTDSVITECYFLKSKKSIFEMIMDFIKGGILDE